MYKDFFFPKISPKFCKACLKLDNTKPSKMKLIMLLFVNFHFWLMAEGSMWDSFSSSYDSEYEILMGNSPLDAN